MVYSNLNPEQMYLNLDFDQLHKLSYVYSSFWSWDWDQRNTESYFQSMNRLHQLYEKRYEQIVFTIISTESNRILD